MKKKNIALYFVLFLLLVLVVGLTFLLKNDRFLKKATSTSVFSRSGVSDVDKDLLNILGSKSSFITIFSSYDPSRGGTPDPVTGRIAQPGVVVALTGISYKQDLKTLNGAVSLGSAVIHKGIIKDISGSYAYVDVVTSFYPNVDATSKNLFDYMHAHIIQESLALDAVTQGVPATSVLPYSEVLSNLSSYDVATYMKRGTVWTVYPLLKEGPTKPQEFLDLLSRYYGESYEQYTSTLSSDSSEVMSKFVIIAMDMKRYFN